MKRLLPILALVATPFGLWAQESAAPTATPAATYGLGDGLRFSLSEDAYRFKISGFLQPSYQLDKMDKSAAQHTFRTKRAYLNFSASGLQEKVSVFVQANFSQATPLLDAYGTWHFLPGWGLSLGQRRTFTNNREMTFDEDKLQFTERGQLSQAFNGNGREFGAFVEGKIGKSFVIVPQLAVTSGDGPNSFGANAQDTDLGKLKYGGRLDVYPLGEFTEGNQGFAADLKHEASPKLVLGVAGSLNQGASNAKGEGHGDFAFYGKNKRSKLPDLRKLSADLLFKFQGFSLLAEYTNTSAANLNGIYLDTTAAPTMLLKPGQISQYLVLGNAWNVQAGYALKQGYAVDVRYEQLNPEFTDQAASHLQQAKVSTLGLSKYFKGNNLKVQAQASRIEYQNAVRAWQGEFIFQVVF